MTWDHAAPMPARIRIKVSDEHLGAAIRLINECKGGALPAEPGTRVIRERPGYTLIAVRLRCGGIDLRQTTGRTAA